MSDSGKGPGVDGVPLDGGTARRKKRGLRVRIGIFQLHGGRCYLCGKPIVITDKWELDHIHAIGLGGLDNNDNLRPTHVDCHKRKTFGSRSSSYGSDIHAMAKLKRILIKWGPPNPVRVEGSLMYPKPVKRIRKGRRINSRKFGT